MLASVFPRAVAADTPYSCFIGIPRNEPQFRGFLALEVGYPARNDYGNSGFFEVSTVSGELLLEPLEPYFLGVFLEPGFFRLFQKRVINQLERLVRLDGVEVVERVLLYV